MEITLFETIDSTSTEAMKRLELAKEPFAIQAITQTSGRGRRGNQWQSERGNLFISVGFPQNFLQSDQVDKTPLKAAVIAAKFIEHLTSLKPQIKWPNDILLDGEKVCGILCESSVTANTISGVVIGVGVNLSSYPEDVGYKVNSLNRKTSIEIDPIEAGRILADSFLEDFPKSLDFSAYRSYLPRVNSLVSSEKSRGMQKKVGLFKGVSNDGNLLISKINFEDKVEEYSSVTDSVRLIGQESTGLPLVTADFGNTSAKIEVTKDADLIASYSISYELTELDKDILDDIRDSVFSILPLGVARWPLYYGSVNNEGRNIILKEMEELGFFGEAITKAAFRVKLGNYPIDQIGFDRLALMESFLFKNFAKDSTSNNLACLISFGTATTVDFVLENGAYLGGVILPGISLSAKSLNDHTSLLPLVSFENVVENSIEELKVGSDTRTSIESGILASQFGAIKECIRSVQSKNKGAQLKKVVVTGGGWAKVKPFFNDSFKSIFPTSPETSYSPLNGYKIIFINSKS